MTIKPITAALTLLLSFSCAAFATAAPVNELYPQNMQLQSTPAKSRTEVVAEVKQASIAGTVTSGELGFIPGQTRNTGTTRLATSGKTRAEVIAELRQAKSDGTMIAIGEINILPVAQLSGTPRSRADVRAEAIQSATAGTTGIESIRRN